AFMPIASATGPLTTRSGATFSSVVCTPRRLKSGSAMARTAASTTGRYSGRQPAITAFAATFSTVATPFSGSRAPRLAVCGSGTQESISSTRPIVGGTIGSPSVQPRRRKSRFTSSVASSPRTTSTRWRGKRPASGVRSSMPLSSARARKVSSIHSPEARWPEGLTTQREAAVMVRLRPSSRLPRLAPRPSQLLVPAFRQADLLPDRIAEHAVVGEHIGIRTHRVARHGDQDVVRLGDDRNQPFRIARLREDARRLAEVHHVEERAPARHEIVVAADVLLELPGRQPGLLEQGVLQVVARPARLGDRLREDRRQQKQRPV